MSAAQKEAALKKQNLNKVNKKKSPAQDREDEDDGNFDANVEIKLDKKIHFALRQETIHR